MRMPRGRGRGGMRRAGGGGAAGGGGVGEGGGVGGERAAFIAIVRDAGAHQERGEAFKANENGAAR